MLNKHRGSLFGSFWAMTGNTKVSWNSLWPSAEAPSTIKEEKQIPINSVVLSGQRVDLKNVIYNAAKAKDQEKEATVNPLVQNGKKLIPSVTRVCLVKVAICMSTFRLQQGAPSGVRRWSPS